MEVLKSIPSEKLMIETGKFVFELFHIKPSQKRKNMNILKHSTLTAILFRKPLGVIN